MAKARFRAAVVTWGLLQRNCGHAFIIQGPNAPFVESTGVQSFRSPGKQARTYTSTRRTMVEGHSVHRVATMHRNRLIGKIFTAVSPNGRFTDGAKAINGKKFYRIEAVGKNLFAFFGDESDPVVVHVHFGMAGNWAVYESTKDDPPPEPTPTNRLRLECKVSGIVADLSAMTVQHGEITLYEEKRAKLGEDPLRHDADPERLWGRVEKSKKSIGALIMDQSYFTGPGNIYRAEILFKARVHPNRLGSQLEKEEFDLIWSHTVALLQRGYETGSILTVDPEDAKDFGNLRMRRYIYNTSKCPRCSTSIVTWAIANRTCYACPTCQPIHSKKNSKVATAVASDTAAKPCVPFNSHCARESVRERLKDGDASRLTTKEIKAELSKLGVETPEMGCKKRILVGLLEKQLTKKPNFVSSEDAAKEKALAGESLAVEHIAELAPGQARKARSKTVKAEEAEASSASKPVKELTVVQLKEKLSRSGIDIPSKARKARLLELLRDAESNPPDVVSSTDGDIVPSATFASPRKLRGQAVTPSPRKTKRMRRL